MGRRVGLTPAPVRFSFFEERVDALAEVVGGADFGIGVDGGIDLSVESGIGELVEQALGCGERGRAVLQQLLGEMLRARQ